MTIVRSFLNVSLRNFAPRDAFGDLSFTALELLTIRTAKREAGDVVIWVRDLVIAFEIIWKNTEASDNTRRFVQRIGHKRDQLCRDRQTYENEDTEISMTNQDGETILFDHRYFNDVAFCGIVIVDSELPLEKLHFETINKTLSADFSLAVMTTRDFQDLL